MKTFPCACLAIVALASCTRHPVSLPSAQTRCFDTQRIDTALFEPVDDSALIAQAIRAPDSGGVRCAATYRLRAGTQVTLHRTFGGGARRMGRWWTFSLPGSDSGAYRTSYEICPSWNSLDSLLTCDPKPGTHLAVGPGQSAWCGGVRYGTSDSLQVFLAHPQTEFDTTSCKADGQGWN